MLTLDHIVVAATRLETGVAYVKDRLGVDIPTGGKHPLMGTHNHVMQLGQEAFLEVIAVDPDATSTRTRWFGLDQFTGSPRVIHWVARVARMTDIDHLAVDVGRPLDVTRGEMFWQLAVRDDGTMPFDGAFPSIIDWPDGQFPVPRMADLGCSLDKLTLCHPAAQDLKAALRTHLSDPRVHVEQGDHAQLFADIQTPTGIRRI